MKAWLEERKDRIEVFYLPSYAPELNPDERLNADMKHAISTKVPVRSKAKLKAAAEAHMDTIGQSQQSGACLLPGSARCICRLEFIVPDDRASHEHKYESATRSGARPLRLLAPPPFRRGKLRP